MSDKLLMLCYTSIPAFELSGADIEAIVATARANNARDAITGWLTYSPRAFAQMIEGPPELVLALYERLKADTRHQRILPVLVQEVEQRRSAGNPMQFVPLLEGQSVRQIAAAHVPPEFISVLETAL